MSGDEFHGVNDELGMALPDRCGGSGVVSSQTAGGVTRGDPCSGCDDCAHAQLMERTAPQATTKEEHMDQCRNCGTSGPTQTWVGDGGLLAMTHGWGVPWCMRCITEAQLTHARTQASLIPALEARLQQLAGEKNSCTPVRSNSTAWTQPVVPTR